MSAVPPSSGLPAAAGDLIAGRYRLDRILASGGMATVWEGEDTVLERAVAVKILHPHLANDASFVGRFRSEAIAAARLRHANIVSIFDTAEEGGTEAIVLELIRGRSLREYLDRHGSLAPAEAVHIAAEVASGLAAAHEAGLVHRDIKPANILIREDGQVLVTDFGIAKLDGQSQDYTTVGTLIGSVKYLSPEQVEGKVVDARSDVYSLGIVLYEMLCGRPPFVGESDAATALARLHEDPPPPHRFQPSVAPGLEQILLLMLSRHPENRLASAAETRRALLGTPTTADATRAVPADATRVAPVVPRPAPAPVPSPARPAPSAQHRVSRNRPRPNRVLVVLLLFIVVGLAFAVAGVLIGRTDLGQRLAEEIRDLWRTEESASTSSGELDTRGQGTDSTDDTVAVGPPSPVGLLDIVAAADFDPFGDDAEHPELAAFAADGNAASTWTTETYDSGRDVGAYKGGVGLLIELDPDSVIDDVIVRSPIQNWGASLYILDSPVGFNPDLPPVARQSGIGGDLSLDIAPTPGRFVVVWITDLGDSVPAQMQVTEIEVSGS